ncbi:MAG: DNA adenine methylase [Bacillota bacterium]
MIASPVLKYPGAKWSIADWIIQNLPKHTTYLEPFFGSGAVFFRKSRSKVETINDIDGNVVNLFYVIREQPEELARLIEWTPWSRDEYYASYETTGNSLEDARIFLVRSWQAFGFRPSDRTGWRCNIKDLNGNIGSWDKKLPQMILQAAERLRGVQIENQPALKVIKRYSQPGVLIYADPPYPLGTRSNRMYAHEMTDTDHQELLELLNGHPGPVLLSGYACQLYDERLIHWERLTAKAYAEGGRERREVLWLNQVAAESVKPYFGKQIR